MLRRLTLVLLGCALLAVGLPLSAEEGTGAQDLALGREALARGEARAAVEHLKAAVRALDPKDGAALGDAWLQLGLAYLNGLGNPGEALPAFLASAALAPEPSTAWLWASVAAEKLGRVADAAAWRTRAVTPPAPPPVPEPAVPAELAPAPEPEPAPAPDAIQHFFGEQPAAPSSNKEEPPSAPQEPPAPEKPAKPEEKKKVDAIDHFFGEKPPAEAKPPAGS